MDEGKIKTISELVQNMLNEPTDYQCEEKLNTIIYDMYGLTKDEINIVEGEK